MSRWQITGLACAMSALAGGCISSPPPKLAAAVARAPAVPDTQVVLADAEQAHVLRIRSRTCDSVGVGSGFLVGSDTLVTNRHVVDGSVQLEVDTWDGRHLTVAVASQASVDDLAILRLTTTFRDHAELASSDPVPGDRVRAVGYPHGDKVTTTRGRVVDYVDGSKYDSLGSVLRASNEIAPGSSGGPLLDAAGRVVGVVYAIDLKDGNALVIPVSRLSSALIRSDQFRPVSACVRR